MGTIVLDEHVPVRRPSGLWLYLSAWTTTSDLADPEGTVGIAGYAGQTDETPVFSVQVPRAMFDDKWFRRFCDALAAHPDFLDRLCAGGALTAGFEIPAAPSRNRDRAVERLLKLGGQARFKDFAALRSGRDAYSGMRLEALTAALGAAAVAVHERFGGIAEVERGAEAAKAMRWMLRGLTLELAVRKVEVDREVTTNASGKRRRG